MLTPHEWQELRDALITHASHYCTKAREPGIDPMAAQIYKEIEQSAMALWLKLYQAAKGPI